MNLSLNFRTSIRCLSRIYHHSRFCTAVNQLNNIPNNSSDVSSESDTLVDPLKHPDFFQVHKMFTVKNLLDANVHLGHKTGSMNQHMKPFLFGSRLDHLIFDLDQTAELLRDALNFTAHIAYRKGIILFVSQNRMTSHIVEKTAKECGEYAHTRMWAGGIFTNSTAQFGGLIRLPDLVIFINSMRNIFDSHYAVRDSAKMLIPSVGVVDSNSDPRLVTYPIPGNDDSVSAVNLYCKLFKQAILAGKKKREELNQTSE